MSAIQISRNKRLKSFAKSFRKLFSGALEFVKLLQPMAVLCRSIHWILFIGESNRNIHLSFLKVSMEAL